jgi:predicted Zn-dependent protease with MMP-like domain
MNIGVYGYTDKRPIIYPMMKLLQATGDVALFSNNRHYKRLLEDFASYGHMANIMISVSDSTPDEIFEELGQAPDDFDHIIYDIQDSVPEKLDLVIYIKTYQPSEEEINFLELLGNHTEVKITYDGKSDKGILNVAPVSSIWSGIEFIEAFRVLAPIKSVQLNSVVADMLCQRLMMNKKDAVKVLARRWQG